MNYNTFFNINIKQVEKEVKKLKRQIYNKRYQNKQYDEYGRPVENSSKKKVDGVKLQ